jgi:exosortase A-associated hydrolase 2
VKRLPSGASAEAFFINGTAGKLFIIHYSPLEYPSSRRAVIIFPPFAEEMNKSRRMMALQARALAAEGMQVLMVDLYGTGESAGDFEQARWEIWREDIEVAASWLEKQGVTRFSALGLRLGALLAMDFNRRWGDRFERIVLWQPVQNGAAVLTQFLRTRWAASMLDSAREAESTQDLRQKLRRGDSVEVAGYQLSPQLFRSIEELQLVPLANPGSPPIYWLEVVSPGGSPLSVASKRVLETWGKSAIPVSATSVQGEPFWATPELTEVPRLIHATTNIFRAQS